MSKENEPLHRVLKYAGDTLIEVVNDVLETEVQAIQHEWEDSELNRYIKCLTFKCDDNDETIIDDEELALFTEMRVYMFATQAGIINIVAPNRDRAEKQLKLMLENVKDKYDVDIEIAAIEESERVHIFVDEHGLTFTAIDAKDIYEASITPFEE